MGNEPIFSVLSGKFSNGFILSNFPAPSCDMQDYYNYAGCSDCFCEQVSSAFLGGNPDGTYNSAIMTNDGVNGDEPGYRTGRAPGQPQYIFMHNLDLSCNGGDTDQKWILVAEGCSSDIIATAPGTQGNFPASGWTLTPNVLSNYRNCVGCDPNFPAALNLIFTPI